jgi:hypothetical protein
MVDGFWFVIAAGSHNALESNICSRPEIAAAHFRLMV